MITDYDDANLLGEDHQPPNYESEFINAKTFLQKTSATTGDNLYDHLTDTLDKILAERPENVIDIFEEYSRKVKEKRFKPLTDHLEDIYVPPERLTSSTHMLALLKPIASEGPSTVDPADLELADMSNNNLMELLYYLEQAGLGLPRTEMYCILLGMRKLVHTEPIASIRFWGKIFGRFKNYVVFETELKEEEYMRRNEVFQKEQEELQTVPNPVEKSEDVVEAALGTIQKEQELFGEDSKYPRKLPDAPKIIFEPPAEPPIELSGIGVNKKVYYVSNGIGEQFIQLPDATPKQLRVARQIYCAFTGHLEHEIQTYPEFPGKENAYLRSQIARISAGTQISPLGFYTFGSGDFGEDAEEEEEEAAGGASKSHYKINPKYDPVPIKDLLDNSMSFWVHHTSYILPQGRTTWWNPSPLPDVDDEELGEELGEEEEDEEEKNKAMLIEPETGPALLTPCSEDAALEAVPAWTVRCTSNAVEEFALAVVRSNLWPGAYCVATQRKRFDNVYFGNGQKYLEQNFSPLPLPAVEQEYPIGPEILEINDPTGAEEEQWRIDHLPKPKAPVEEEVEEAEEEEEEDEEDEEDD